jgi:cytosine/adenosine deaminase-related metal-dependent hydrolase
MAGSEPVVVDWLFEQPGVKPPLNGARITFDGDRIASIEPAPGRHQGGRAAFPALVNAHDHGRSFRPVAQGIPDQPLESWLSILGRNTPKGDVYTQCVVAFGRMLLGGIGAVTHVHLQQGGAAIDEAKAVARAANDLGMRVAHAVPVIDTNAFVYGGPDTICGCYRPEDWAIVRNWDGRPLTARQQIEAVEEIDETCGGPLVTVQYAPAGPHWVSEAGWEFLAERAEQSGRRVHTHLLETSVQRQWADGHYPDGLLAFFDRIGILSSKLTVAHCVWPTDSEIELLAERGVTVSVNNSSNLRLQSGIAPVRRFKQAGLAFGYGLDGLAFNDDEDAVFELRLLAKLHGPRGFDDPGISIADTWAAATRVGRRTIDNVETYGEIAPGSDADLMIIDLDAMGGDIATDLVDPLDLMMTRGRNVHVTDVYVAGRQVVSSGRLTGVDFVAAEAELMEMARRAAPRIGGDQEVLARHHSIIREHYLERRHLLRRDG